MADDVFAAEKAEIQRKQAYRHAPWTTWICLDPLDGLETKCGEYEDPVPLGGFPKCPKCGSKVALPKEAYAINEQQRVDAAREAW